MENALSGVDFVSAPKDYADLFRIYYPYVVALVRKNGIDESRKEDVASEILLRFMERGFLDKFDPDLKFEYEGRVRPARFKTFLSYFVIYYVRGHRDRQHRLANKEMLVLDRSAAGSQDPHSAFNEMFIVESTIASHEDDVLDLLHGETLVADIRTYLKTVPPRCKYDQCDLVELFDAVVEQIRTKEDVVVRELRERFGVSATGMNGWMWWLRANIAEYLGIPLPAKRTRRTS